MANERQFEEDFPTADCALWEAMCPEAVDGTLSEAERRAFDRHVAGCARCAEELEQAQRGAAWLNLLKGHTPEPPVGLMERILAETTGAEAVSPAFAPESAPVSAPLPAFVPSALPQPAFVAPEPQRGSGWLNTLWARTVDIFRIENANVGFQPRFAMTAAMAFFSIALSLNLMGVHLRDLRSFSLRPGALARTAADTGASIERNFQNMRVVYQVESRVSELRRDDEPAAGFENNAPPLDDQPQAQPPTPNQATPQNPQPASAANAHERRDAR